MIKSLSREDHSILMNILLHRDNFEHSFCFDLPVYFVFVHWLYRYGLYKVTTIMIITHWLSSFNSCITVFFQVLLPCIVKDAMKNSLSVCSRHCH